MGESDTGVQPRRDAGKATAEAGMVILDGPDGGAVTMTAEAAEQTAQSLQDAARIARQQNAAQGDAGA